MIILLCTIEYPMDGISCKLFFVGSNLSCKHWSRPKKVEKVLECRRTLSSHPLQPPDGGLQCSGTTSWNLFANSTNYHKTNQKMAFVVSTYENF